MIQICCVMEQTIWIDRIQINNTFHHIQVWYKTLRFTCKAFTVIITVCLGYYGEYGPYGPNQADNTGINHENAVLSSTSPLASPNGTPSIQSDHLLREASNQILNSNNLTNQVSHLHEAMPQLHAHIPTVPSSVSWPENMALVSHGCVLHYTMT